MYKIAIYLRDKLVSHYNLKRKVTRTQKSNCKMENVWGAPETELLDAMRRTQDLSVLGPLSLKIKWPNAFQFWKNADFTLLFHASIINNSAAVQLLLKAGADPTLTNIKGTNAFMLFAKRGQIQMAEACLAQVPKDKRGATVNAATVSGWTALMTAAENNQLEFAKWLIANGADVNGQMLGSLWTAGHAAAKRGNLEILELLLQNGVNQASLACHREFGRNLTFADVTTDERVLNLLKKYP